VAFREMNGLTRFQYTTREFDSESGLYYYRARYYDPSVGVFQAEDPVEFRGGINFYSYVRNRPTVMRDPTGRFAWGGGATVSGLIGAFWTGAAGEGSCLVVGDTQGNTGVLCCLGLGGGAINGLGVSGQATSVVCPNCRTICDMEGGFVQMQAFAGIGAIGAAGGGASISMTSASLSASGGGGVGAGAGVAVVGGSCKLIVGGKRCKTCPLSQK